MYKVTMNSPRACSGRRGLGRGVQLDKRIWSSCEEPVAMSNKQREREREKERVTLMDSSWQGGARRTALETRAVTVGVNGGGGHTLLRRDPNAGGRAT
jgi:hypothetical protein